MRVAIRDIPPCDGTVVAGTERTTARGFTRATCSCGGDVRVFRSGKIATHRPRTAYRAAVGGDRLPGVDEVTARLKAALGDKWTD